jgi:predicted  nucleic acid-binding Zn-ribbon protein
MGIRSYFRDVRERLVHIEDKTDGISSNVQSSSEDIQAVTATVKHVNENCVDSRERLIHVENKENDIRDRVIHIEDKVDKLLSRDSEKMYTGFLPDGLETAESRGGGHWKAA